MDKEWRSVVFLLHKEHKDVHEEHNVDGYGKAAIRNSCMNCASGLALSHSSYESTQLRCVDFGGFPGTEVQENSLYLCLLLHIRIQKRNFINT
ncbi:MAG: hypothetical protein CVU11_14840 [Bacteroidetes bacterium HGW-Bacteroidetes-6]|jgi:hypothetical protein|nr:MAG: hypothetical protein CVU11_14840 [Bacteroidetes bacterium HGW-Bacteroidetes-6]